MKKNISIDVLSRLIKFLDTLNIPFHFACGTLLGYVRDKDIIDGDTDIDLFSYAPYIAIIFQNRDKLKEYNLNISRQQKGAKLLKSNKKNNNKTVYNTKIRHAGKVKYIWRLSFNGTNKGEGMNDDPQCFRWIDIYGGHWFPLLKQVEYKNFIVYIPENSNKYLDFTYQEWLKPVHRSKFIRPKSAEPIFQATTLFFSEYGIKYRNNKYEYIDEKVCEDYTTIEEFIQNFPFINDIVKPTLEIIDEQNLKKI